MTAFCVRSRFVLPTGGPASTLYQQYRNKGVQGPGRQTIPQVPLLPTYLLIVTSGRRYGSDLQGTIWSISFRLPYADYNIAVQLTSTGGCTLSLPSFSPASCRKRILQRTCRPNRSPVAGLAVMICDVVERCLQSNETLTLFEAAATAEPGLGRVPQGR
jgi:hypothetical protein